MKEPAESDWQRLLGRSAAPPPSAGFTLRVLTALPPPRPGHERLRARVLLLAALLAAALLSFLVLPMVVPLVLPAPAGSSAFALPLLLFLALAALTFWTVFTAAD